MILAELPFATIQGEGFYIGTPMIFIRMGGCSVACPKCDTNYVPKLSMNVDQIAGMVSSYKIEWVWITGGEPTDQMDELKALIKMLNRNSHKVALATSGVRLCPFVDFLSVSPHGNFLQKQGSEIKLVPGLNGLDINNLDLSDAKFPYKYVMPQYGSKDSMQSCLEWVKKHPEWKITVQAHKSWGLK